MRTDLDPVRYLQNRSSGKMGLELARAAEKFGARVSVLLGPVDPTMARAFARFTLRRYLGPAQYAAELPALFAACDIFLSLAAVLDFELISQTKKIERQSLAGASNLTLPLRSVPDFVAQMAARKRRDQLVIAFAAENGTDEEITSRAQAKMQKKNVDAIVANPVRPGLGPEAELNELWILRPGKPALHRGPAPKEDLAAPLLQTLFAE